GQAPVWMVCKTSFAGTANGVLLLYKRFYLYSIVSMGMQLDVSVKQAQESNWQDLRFIRLKALQSDPSVFESNYQKESAMTEAEWKSWLQTDDTAIFLIYEDASLIGMTGIAVDRGDPTKKRAILWGSWLEPSARGKGLSQIMYQRRIKWAEKH